MIKFISILILSSLLFSSCSRSTPEFYLTDHGLKYKYHDISSEEISPSRGDYLTVYMHWKTIDDSVFYDSKKVSPTGVDIIKLGKPKQLGGIEEGFSRLKKGDSVSFYITPKRFYKDYLNQDNIPHFLKESEEMIITLRLLTIESEKEHKINIEDKKETLELEELKAISQLIVTWKAENDTVIAINGSYLVIEPTADTNKIKSGDLIKLDYEAAFLNGTIFYSTFKNGSPDEFQIGKDAQLIDGLKNALYKMNYNQKAKVLVPSYQGFNTKGAAGRIIPAYTPIIFKLSVLPKNI